MKDKTSKLLIVLLCVMLVFNFMQIRGLEREVDQLRNALNNQTRNLENSISGIYREVNNMLEEEASILSVYDWGYGEVDVAARTAQIDVTVVPKEYTPNATKVSVLGNGVEYPLTLQDGKYKASISVPLFETSNFTQVLIKDGDIVRTEAIGLSAEPSLEALIDVTTSCNGKARFNTNDGMLVWQPQWLISINTQMKGSYRVQGVALVEVLNGEEVGRRTIDISKEGQADYVEQAEKLLDISRPENLHAGETLIDGSASFVYYLDKEYRFTDGRMDLYVEVVDEYGLRHWALVDSCTANADGSLNNEAMEELDIFVHIGTMYIYDENGELLYELDRSLYM